MEGVFNTFDKIKLSKPWSRKKCYENEKRVGVLYALNSNCSTARREKTNLFANDPASQL